MARYLNSFQTNLEPQEADAIVGAYMQSEGFKLIKYSATENLWKKGSGLLTYPQYLKVVCQNYQITVEAFLKYPILPGVYVSEIGIDGAFAFAIKEVLKGRVKQIEYQLQDAAFKKQQATAPQQPVQPVPQEPVQQ